MEALQDVQAIHMHHGRVVGHPEIFQEVFGGNQVFHGSIYAPNARLKYVGNAIVEGSLFAGELVGIGNFEIHNARPKPPMGCPGGAGSPPSTTPPGTTPPSGSTPSTPSAPSNPDSTPGQAPPDLDDGSRVVTRDDGVGTPPLR